MLVGTKGLRLRKLNLRLVTPGPAKQTGIRRSRPIDRTGSLPPGSASNF